MLANDVVTDAGVGHLAVASVDAHSADGAALSINLDGTIHYDPTNAAVLQALGAEQSLTDTFSYQATDGYGHLSTATVTLTVYGVNNEPVFTSIQGRTLGFADVDTEDHHSVHVDNSTSFGGNYGNLGNYGILSISATVVQDTSLLPGDTGPQPAGQIHWDYAIDNAGFANYQTFVAANQGLFLYGAAQAATETFQLQLDDAAASVFKDINASIGTAGADYFLLRDPGQAENVLINFDAAHDTLDVRDLLSGTVTVGSGLLSVGHVTDGTHTDTVLYAGTTQIATILNANLGFQELQIHYAA